jgi:hypothetical protein
LPAYQLVSIGCANTARPAGQSRPIIKQCWIAKPERPAASGDLGSKAGCGLWPIPWPLLPQGQWNGDFLIALIDLNAAEEIMPRELIEPQKGDKRYVRRDSKISTLLE